MALPLYLAMTAAEIQLCTYPPEKIAWMACHFSPYSTGLTNLPAFLPPGSALILNDRIPPQGHDPACIARQLAQAAEALEAERVLLDLERAGCPENAAIAEAVAAVMGCRVAVTPAYADALDCAVFLTPRLRVPLQTQLERWQGREIWLEAALDCEEITVTELSCTVLPGTPPAAPDGSHEDALLHCRYRVRAEGLCSYITAWRGPPELKTLLAEAEALDVSCAIGLYQQLSD